MVQTASKNLLRALERARQWSPPFGLSRTATALQAALLPNEPLWHEYRGMQLYIDPTELIGRRIYLGFHEPNIENIAAKYIPKGGTAFDVGGHVGMWTLLMREQVGENGSVTTFEPHPLNASFIRKTLAKNGFQNIHLVEAAASNEAGTTKLTTIDKATGLAYINQATGREYDTKKMAGEFTVDTVPLAEYIAESGIAHIDFMKIDTEGAELSVLRGLGGALNVIDTLLLEVHSNRDVDECQAIWEFLSDGELIHIDTGDQVAGPEELSGAKVLWES